ncbi:hypothetical protein DW159_01405 [Coprococcus sp. AM14-16]|uniref:excisionase n=1 Tax=Coprococcus TaxID=33042 RepID=UPI000E400EF9|nr:MULTISPECIES: excisionase [Coprococcus]RGD40684.1 hypothetical protein DW159_01405 [Coprococcus sp. AM14-16]
MCLITDNSKEVQGQVPIYQKVTLTIKETAEYSNIGINRIESLLRAPRCPFVLYVGKKKLVKRKEFEKFISENIEI